MKDNYKNLENGDIIVIDTENGNMICVYKSVTPDGTAVTSYCSCTMEDYPKTFMAHVDGSIIGCPDYIDFISMANDYEKHMLYDALISQFKIENPKWDKPFTDSVHDEIKEWITYMCNITAIDMEDAPDFVYDFAFYAYGKLCMETGNYRKENCDDHKMVNLVKRNDMETNYTPGQILYIQSAPNYFYISVMRSMQQHPDANDVNRYEINTCCDLCVDVYSGEMYPASITFARGGNASTWDVDIEFDEVRPAYDFEKKLLFDRLVDKFKLYDPKWMHSFTDSTYYDIRNWLCWAFDVDINLLPNDSTLPATIYEITKYIWDELCKETGNYQEETVEPKMVSLDKACKVVSEMVQKFCPNLIRCGEDLKYWEDEFRKRLEG